jgi:hypothetical protein
MLRKAALADGTKPGVAMLPADAILRVVESDADHWRTARGAGEASVERHRRVAALLLRELGGLTFAAIARFLGVAPESARRFHARARALLVNDEEFGHTVASLGHGAMVAVFGSAPFPRASHAEVHDGESVV